jgi:hypothetical protein
MPTLWGSSESPLADIPKPIITKVTYDYCLRSLKHISLRGKLSEKDEDLGTEMIRWLEAQGCRTINIAAGGTYITDNWLAKTNTGKLLNMKEEWEYPSDGGGSMKGRTELTTQTVGEPDVAKFYPPKDYEVTKVLMQEVPCESLVAPKRSASLR